ncbi:MAG: hypothetical protein KGJ02_08180 [Verrucomicrobiota bacterium]|nr:hypothetical protein [Verrucomicrobiota bacterium]
MNFADIDRPQGNVPFDAEWVLLSKNILEESFGKTYDEQIEIVNQFGTNYEIPSLTDVVVSTLLHKVATQESLFGDGLLSKNSTYTRVKEVSQSILPWGPPVQNLTGKDIHWVVGGHGFQGLRVFPYADYTLSIIGVAPRLRL